MRPEIGTFMHPSEGEMVCESTNPKIPYFNAPVYLENKVSVVSMSEEQD
jgi:H/ACA ribonucleoprotein complex subunit 1